MIVVMRIFLDRRAVYYQVIGRIIQHAHRLAYHRAQHAGQVLIHGGRRVLKRGLVSLGQNPRFKRKPWRIRTKRHKVLVFRGNSHPRLCFLPDNVTENTAFFVGKIPLCAFQLFHHLLGQNWKRDDLRMRMLQGRARGFAMVLKNQNVLEPAVLLQVQNAVAESPQHIFDAF